MEHTKQHTADPLLPEANPVAMGVPVVDVQPGGHFVATALPYYEHVAAQSPLKVWGQDLDEKTTGVLAATSQFTVRQHMKLRALMSNQCITPPSTFTVYAGLTDDSMAELFRVQELSDNCSRTCCTPCHPVKLEVKSHMSAPRVGGQSAEIADLEREIAGAGCDCGRRTRGVWELKQRVLAEREVYAAQPALFTVVRNGYRCLSCRGCADSCCCQDAEGDAAARFIPRNDELRGANKWVGCGACTSGCRDGATLVAGVTAERSTLMIGELPGPSLSRVVAAVDQVFSWFTPTLLLNFGAEPARAHGGDPAAEGVVTGPTCFGGCSQLCIDTEFPTSRLPAPAVGGAVSGRPLRIGDIAIIVKRKPANCIGAARELLSTADVYTIEFTDPAATVEQKAGVLASALLLDYMLFERKQDMCGTTDDGTFFINMCDCYLGGCVCPCRIYFPKNQK